MTHSAVVSVFNSFINSWLVVLVTKDSFSFSVHSQRHVLFLIPSQQPLSKIVYPKKCFSESTDELSSTDSICNLICCLMGQSVLCFYKALHPTQCSREMKVWQRPEGWIQAAGLALDVLCYYSHISWIPPSIKLIQKLVLPLYLPQKYRMVSALDRNPTSLCHVLV